jgi:hypothetical protein
MEFRGVAATIAKIKFASFAASLQSIVEACRAGNICRNEHFIQEFSLEMFGVIFLQLIEIE